MTERPTDPTPEAMEASDEFRNSDCWTHKEIALAFDAFADARAKAAVERERARLAAATREAEALREEVGRLRAERSLKPKFGQPAPHNFGKERAGPRWEISDETQRELAAMERRQKYGEAPTQPTDNMEQSNETAPLDSLLRNSGDSVAVPDRDGCPGSGKVGTPTTDDVERAREWPDPTPEMLDDPVFNAIWSVIKTWDINVPEAYGGYCGATGNHVRAILDALSPALTAASPTGRAGE